MASVERRSVEQRRDYRNAMKFRLDLRKEIGNGFLTSTFPPSSVRISRSLPSCATKGTNMKNRLPIFIASILLAPLSFADPNPPTEPAPTKADIPALIKQLGDDSPKVRDQASEKLRHLGADAIPALTEA